MNLGDIWDWDFMWQMFRNFMVTYQPFVMIIVAVGVATMLMGFLVSLFMRKKSND